MTSTLPPLIVAFVADLLFTARLDSAAQALGYRVRWIERADYFAGEEVMDDPGEALLGRAGGLTRLVAEEQPALLIFDLNNDAIPWARWIARLKSSPATRRFPILCFGSHVDEQRLQTAQRAGADRVVARGRFAAALPELIQQQARQPDYEGVATACLSPLSAAAQEGIELFNQGLYFEAHEELELAWKEDAGPGRDLYRAILQIAVAYLQIERGNYRGALKMFLRVQQWLAPLPPVCRGVDVADLRRNAERVYTTLLELGEARLGELDHALFQPVRWRPAANAPTDPPISS